MIVGKARGRLSIDGEPDLYFEKPITPEEVGMGRDSLAELVGDGDARVTASLELKDSDFGTGFGAHVSVSLSVDQTEKCMNGGFSLALDLAQEFVDEAFDTAHSLLRKKEKEGKLTTRDSSKKSRR